MCYKGIIALKDAYRDPSSLQSGEFSLVINKGVLVGEVLTSIDVRMKLKDLFLNNWKCDIYLNKKSYVQIPMVSR